MLLIKPKVNQEKAKSFLTKKNFIFSNGKALRLELLYLPYYRIDFEIIDKKGKKILGGGLYDGIIGNFSILDNPKNIEFEQNNSDVHVFDFCISKSEALSVAKDEISKINLKHALRAFTRSFDSFNILNVEEIGFPYYVQYFEKRNKYYFKALDGVSGEKAGIRVKKAILEGISKQKR